MTAVTSDLHVDADSIERRLAELWQSEKSEGERGVTRAALWNVVAHTWTSAQQAEATETLAKASASVPQRTIVVRADPAGDGSLASWISANCHLVGDGRQVCSEEVSIIASGDRVHHVAPLVKALLLPDMPVAVWWVGDLPDRERAYAETLLEPADRLIFDSSHFDGASDLDLVWRIVETTTTAPADLCWARLEEWRAATAAVFDPPAMRAQLHAIRSVRVMSGRGASFGELAEALLYVSWMSAQTGRDVPFDFAEEGDHAGIEAVELHFEDGSIAIIRTDHDRGAVLSTSDGAETAVDCVTRSLGHATEELIVRLLKKPEADRVYLKALQKSREIAKGMVRP